MAKKVKIVPAPKGKELKLETKAEIKHANVKRTLANVKKYGLAGYKMAGEGKPATTVKEIIANERVKSAFRVGKKK